MDIHRHGRAAPDPRRANGRALFVYSLWLRLLLIGLLLAGGGAAALAEGGPKFPSTLVAILGGGMLAAFSWRRAAAVLAAIDAPVTEWKATPTQHAGAYRILAGKSADAVRSRGALAAWHP